MADVIKTVEELKLETLFEDEDTRTITLSNPRADISSSDIQALDNFMLTNEVIVGDKTGADFVKITKAKKVTTSTRTLDLS